MAFRNIALQWEATIAHPTHAGSADPPNGVAMRRAFSSVPIALFGSCQATPLVMHHHHWFDAGSVQAGRPKVQPGMTADRTARAKSCLDLVTG